jgi:hypothetical protein
VVLPMTQAEQFSTSGLLAFFSFMAVCPPIVG